MKLFIPLILLLLVSACHHAQSSDHTALEPFYLTPKGDTIFRVIKTEDQWKSKLTELEYHVLRESGTERAWSGPYNRHKQNGVYQCKACGFPLFSSKHKYDSGSGWPSYYAPINDYCLREIKDSSLGMVRVEVRCAKCDGHLGHVFDDGPEPTGLRYCINSVALRFEKK